MSDFSDVGVPVVAPHGVLTTMNSPVGEALLLCANAFNSTVAPGALLALYYPVLVPRAITVYQAAWLNGATVAGNVDVGVYDEAGNRMVSTGSTLMAGASVPQTVDIADTLLSPGLYYMAFVSDSATATFQRGFVPSQLARACGMRQQTLGAMPLPQTATFAANASGSAILLSFPIANAVI